MFADIKTIRRGDLIFVHAGDKIYGAFKAESEFVEDIRIDPRFLSSNLHYLPNPSVPNSGWQGNINDIPELGAFRKISISHYINDDNINICFISGIPSVEVFDLKQKSKIRSIPERWKYADASRTIRPIMIDEANELLKSLNRENSDIKERREITPNTLDNYQQIDFILNPNIVENEKIIEGWILDNIGKNDSLDQMIGPFSCFGNNVPAGYLKFMDIFGYQNLLLVRENTKLLK